MIALGAGLDSFSAASKQKNESVLQLEEMCAVVEQAFAPEVGTNQIPPPQKSSDIVFTLKIDCEVLIFMHF